MDALVYFFASNMFSGAIEPAIGNLLNLETLDLSNHNLAPTIPDTWMGLKKLKRFRWNASALALNEIPSWIGSEWPELESFIWTSHRSAGPILPGFGLAI
jgi:hypothetical protein